jgi:hypothetical protein
MPLNAKDEVVSTGVRGLATLDGFDHSILRAAGGDAKAVARDTNGLVMAGVDGETKEAVLLRCFFGGDETTEQRIWRDCRGVSDSYAAAGGVVDGENVEMLNQRTATPDVQGLGAEADGEDWLVEVMGVLDEEFVHVLAGWVGRGTLRDRLLAVFVGVDIRRAAREENPLAGVDQVRDLGWRSFEWDLDGLAAATLNRGGIHGPGALVICEIGAGRKRDGDAGLHW